MDNKPVAPFRALDALHLRWDGPPPAAARKAALSGGPRSRGAALFHQRMALDAVRACARLRARLKPEDAIQSARLRARQRDLAASRTLSINAGWD